MKKFKMEIICDNCKRVMVQPYNLINPHNCGFPFTNLELLWLCVNCDTYSDGKNYLGHVEWDSKDYDVSGQLI